MEADENIFLGKLDRLVQPNEVNAFYSEAVTQCIGQNSLFMDLIVIHTCLETGTCTLNHLQGTSVYEPFHPITDPESLHTLLHRDDRRNVLNAKKTAFGMLSKYSCAERLKHKLVFECRLRNKQGQYQRFLCQYYISCHNSKGEVTHLTQLLYPITGSDPDFCVSQWMILNFIDETLLWPKSGGIITARQLDILRLYERPDIKTNARIAARLGIQENTVEKTRCNLLARLKLKNMEDVLTYARQIYRFPKHSI